jgi:hypothetical protein
MREAPKAVARRVFNSLRLSVPVSLESIVMDVERVRRRRIAIVETPLLSGKKICGLWVPRPDTDVVYHAKTNGLLHRQQMILHELSHMILKHDQLPGTDRQGVRMFQQISGETVERALARGDFRSEAEVTAEYLADFLASAVRQGSPELYRYEACFE